MLETRDRENALRCLHNWPDAAFIIEVVTTHRIMAIKEPEELEIEFLDAESQQEEGEAE